MASTHDNRPSGSPPDGDWLDLPTASDICGVTLALIERAGEEGLVCLRRSESSVLVLLDEDSTYVLRQVHELGEVHRLNWAGIRTVIALRARIDQLEREVGWLRDRLP